MSNFECFITRMSILVVNIASRIRPSFGLALFFVVTYSLCRINSPRDAKFDSYVSLLFIQEQFHLIHRNSLMPNKLPSLENLLAL